MLVSGFKRAFIGALVGGNRVIVIERLRDEPVIAAIRAKIKQFWRDVETGNEPAPIMPGDAEAVIRLNQHAEPGKVLDASGDEKIATLVAEYKRLTAERDTADEAAKVLKAEILIAIGDAEKVMLDGWTISAGTVAETPPTLITAEMIGTTYGGRKGFRNCRITARKEKK
jgi:predicted phage-related endonuclease